MATTHTYAVLGVSRSTYLEIRDRLKVAGYDHAFQEEGGKPVIDMRGLAVMHDPAVDPEPVETSNMKNEKWRTHTVGPQSLTLEIRDSTSSPAWFQAMVCAGLIPDANNVVEVNVRMPYDEPPAITVTHAPIAMAKVERK